MENMKYFVPNAKQFLVKKIEYILFNNDKNKNEVDNLKKLMKKNNTKNIILSNPNLMFCPIADCDGYANKNYNKTYNICNLGHKFCPNCGELWHKNGKCKEGEQIDELFQQYHKRLKLR